ncbi:Tetraacyldisaccharide 4'-kinase [Rickettsiales endosymbiont of Paramecium tredecaurelia]|uniref:tetraacyldisaccharide 4'-kinase n=1 Tax=Candidatus Sarmatiella mevalonica TaxID=2770581 RepID=UPI0019242846|nr:tetraacyldisaccharide 4'-kinase [Candidatus Sarmatiella mevalonica]MBL3285040.1 Tetraacyldisaccharide 4'-kinase [Candidatus Sarmatiella mevalonica]
MHFRYPFWWNSKKIAYCFAIFLAPISILYYLAGWARQALAKPIELQQSLVVCVGNFSVGGTGKTQIIEYLAKKLSELDIHFIIVSKSYKGSLKGAVVATPQHGSEVIGDEAACFVSNGYVVVAACNIKNAIPIIHKINPKVVLLDDGMQNPYLIKDYIIAAVDGVRGFGNGMLIPLGPMRTNHPKNINAIVVTNPSTQLQSQNIRSNHFNRPLSKLAHDEQMRGVYEAQSRSVHEVREDLRIDSDEQLPSGVELGKRSNVFASKTMMFWAKQVNCNAIIAAHTVLLAQQKQKKHRRIAFSGIGNNDNFFSQLRREGFNIIGTISFSDHHRYDLEDILSLHQQACASNATLTTTFKDYIKCKPYCEMLGFEIECINAVLHVDDTRIFDEILYKLEHKIKKR